MNKSRLLAFLPLLGLIVAFGCGSKNPNAPGKLTGKVVYNGAPVTGGALVLNSTSGAISIPIKADGTFESQDLPAGEVVVTVDTESLNPNRKVPTYGGGKGQGSPMPEYANKSAGTYVKVPQKYRDKGTSPLKITIAKGKQDKTIELTD